MQSEIGVMLNCHNAILPECSEQEVVIIRDQYQTRPQSSPLTVLDKAFCLLIL